MTTTRAWYSTATVAIMVALSLTIGQSRPSAQPSGDPAIRVGNADLRHERLRRLGRGLR